jgi:hypothetical protein
MVIGSPDTGRRSEGGAPMKVVVSILLALGAMAVAMVVVSQVLHLDLAAEIRRRMPDASPVDEILPEA